MDPARFEGTVYAAGNWRYLGLTRGFARHNGRYTDAHGRPKEFYIYPLRRDACRRLRDPAPLPTGWEPKGAAGQVPGEMRSLYQRRLRCSHFFVRAALREVAGGVCIDLLLPSGGAEAPGSA